MQKNKPSQATTDSQAQQPYDNITPITSIYASTQTIVTSILHLYK